MKNISEKLQTKWYERKGVWIGLGIVVIVIIVIATIQILPKETAPKETILLDTTGFVGSWGELPSTQNVKFTDAFSLNANQVIHVSLEVISGKPVDIYISTGATASLGGSVIKEVRDTTKTSFDLTIPSDGTYFLEIASPSSEEAHVSTETRIKVSIKA